MNHDMTTGKPISLIIRFMIPVYLGSLFQQFYNLADSVIAGRFIGVNALAAIGSTTSLIFLVIGWLNGLTSGFAILVAQSYGAKDYKRMRHYLAMSIYLCLGMVVVMTTLLEIFNIPILQMMNTPADIMADVAAYMRVIYAGLIVTAAYNGFSAVLRAIGDSKSPLYFLMISAVINVVLDVVFVVYFHAGVVGCGYATVIAQGISALLCLIYIIKNNDILKITKADMPFSFDSMFKMLGLGVPMALQFSITAIGTVIVQGAINIYGAVYIAGFSAAGKVQNIVMTVFISFGATIATYVGQNRGAGKMDRVREGVKVTQWLLLGSSLVIAVFITLCGVPLASLFVGEGDPGVLEAAGIYYRTVTWCYPFLASIFLYRNALQGLGYGLVPMLGGVFELVARFGVVALLNGRGGYQGVCFSDPAAWLFALIPIVPYYYWKRKQLRDRVSET
ncbi:MAG: MATE family efflux transporter [Lachnospiraceae bacterium]|nr:MATE family efflux transporter [Lachnospiraceae bacterium]